MDNFQVDMIGCYEQHPKFRFDQPTLALSAPTLRDFDESYELMRARRGALGRQQFRECLSRCERALAAVFDELGGQDADAQETVFLTELHGECLRLLREEAQEFRHSDAKSLLRADAKLPADASRLRRDRHYFGSLPRAAVDEILAVGAPELEEFRRRAQQGRLTREDLSFNSGPKVKQIGRILNREFAQLGVLDAMGLYMGRRMSVTGIAFELSVPQASWWANAFEGLPRPPKTLYAHVDESIGSPKAIVYLTDVGPENGPTSCYPQAFQSLGLHPLAEMVGRVVGCVGNASDSPLRSYYGKAYHQSMSSERFRRHFMRLPRALRFNSHFGWDVLPDSSVERSLVACETAMVGPAGTFMVFDGATLLHRGGLVRERDRVALQVVFSDLTLSRRIVSKVKKVFA